MYKQLLRPIFFKFQPETIHKLVFAGLKTGQALGVHKLLNKVYNPTGLQMETEFCGLRFPNKVGIAAGLDKNAEVYKMLGSFGFGHIEIGTVTPKGQPGNPKPRSFRLPKDKALINRMGFNNNGLEAAQKALKNRPKDLIIGGNIGKNTLTDNDDALNDYVSCFNGLYDYVDYIVVNVSCPNITDLHKLQDQEQLELILGTLNSERAKKENYKPILLKISPDLNDFQIKETLNVLENNHIDGIIATNTTTKREPLVSEKATIKAIANGGMSGRPIKDRSTEVIRFIHKETQGKLPIIAVGGVFNASDAQEKIDAGATLVQVYTGFIYEGPGIAKQINKYLKLQK